MKLKVDTDDEAQLCGCYSFNELMQLHNPISLKATLHCRYILTWLNHI